MAFLRDCSHMRGIQPVEPHELDNPLEYIEDPEDR